MSQAGAALSSAAHQRTLQTLHSPSHARSVMRYMQRMAHHGGHTIIASIHQPRAAIWAMFDTVSGFAAARMREGRIMRACVPIAASIKVVMVDRPHLLHPQALVLSSSLLMYFGPREGLVPWFEALGALAAAMHRFAWSSDGLFACNHVDAANQRACAPAPRPHARLRLRFRDARRAERLVGLQWGALN